MTPADMPVAILAGGLATRLGAAAAATPKLLLNVAGEPFFTHQIRLLKASGLTRLVVCAGHLSERIVEAFGDGAAHGVRIEYSFDGDRPLGTGGAVIRALPKLGGAFFVLYGDSYLPIDYARVGEAFLASGRIGLMTVFENRGLYDKSNVVFEDGRITAYEKGKPTPRMRHIDYGLGAFTPAAFDRFPRDRAVDLAEVQRALVARGELAGFEVRERFYEIGSPAGLAGLRDMLEKKRGSKDA